MKKIGIDFGTTYSTICYVDESFQPGDGNYLLPYETGAGDTLIPTVVAYHIDDNTEVLVGREALDMVDNPEYHVCRHFKMLLALEGTPLLEQFIAEHPDYAMYTSHAPSMVAHDFFAHLLDWYQRANKVGQIEKIVLTMPLVWTGFDQQLHENTGGAQKLLSQALQAASTTACGGKHKPRVEIRSEPEAAAGYFAYLYKLQHGQYLNGRMLVVDHGGGTLDITLTDVAHTEDGIKVASKARSGKGRHLDYALGVAGVAYDRALADLALQNAKRTMEGAELSEFLDKLEYLKRQDGMRTRLNAFHTKGINNQGMNVKGVKIMPVLCKQAFVAVNEQPLQQALEEVFQEHSQAAKSPNLHVALAGGFSNLPFVEHLVRRYFGAKEDIDDTSDQRFALSTLAQRTHAIAMGAALVAAQKVTIDDKLHYEIGVYVYTIDKGEVFEPVIAYGTEYKQLQQVIWMSAPVQGGAEGIKLGLKESGRADRAARPFRLKHLNDGKNRLGAVSAKSMVPDYEPGSHYRIGFSVPADGEDGVSGRHDLTIHFRNEASGKERAFPIGEVFIEFDTRVDKVQ